MVVLDTDAASLLQRGRLEPGYAGHLAGQTLALTFVTVGEMHKGMALRNWGKRRRTDLEAWIDRFLVVPYSVEVAQRWGEVAAAAQQRGRPRPVNALGSPHAAWSATCRCSRSTAGTSRTSPTTTACGYWGTAESRSASGRDR